MEEEVEEQHDLNLRISEDQRCGGIDGGGGGSRASAKMSRRYIRGTIKKKREIFYEVGSCEGWQRKSAAKSGAPICLSAHLEDDPCVAFRRLSMFVSSLYFGLPVLCSEVWNTAHFCSMGILVKVLTYISVPVLWFRLLLYSSFLVFLLGFRLLCSCILSLGTCW
ncbi:uncharacterized protein A4U43_C07F1730 [Asparagus officinalis]|uniref:Uncharacterized protein n=1 Tax=Asparagus officinalis TaxID=4686 RepID=A0A5P1E8R3_ASPOF|nr:uncharacterized protein A4U43_C07F1730 [Asparagus officinalis]